MNFNLSRSSKIFLVFLFFFVLTPSDSQALKSPYDWALIQLDYVRQEKVERLKQFTEKIYGLSQNASKDSRIIAFFDMNLQYYLASLLVIPPSELTKQVEELRDEFDHYYITKYYAFYDILFVDMEGTVFYSIRKGIETGFNLVKNKKSVGSLGHKISQKIDRESFIDFYHYNPSSEPAAFFLEPVVQDGIQKGWIVLQCAINKFNAIFASSDNLGQTGETFLVNRDGFMLTESFFKGDSSILKQHLNDRNIKAKFNNKIGHRLITDYRGSIALSSFEVVDFMSVKWLVVAKIDKDEITTQHYKQHKQYYNSLLLKELKQAPISDCSPDVRKIQQNTFRVDMDEFLRARSGEKLLTWGVNTCTALIATIPGKFCYLAHISPLDSIYHGSGPSLLDQITKKIHTFDIYPYEKRAVTFVAAAPHLNSITRLIDLLIEDGFFLSQIHIAYHPAARSVEVFTDYLNGLMNFDWIVKKDQSKKCHTTFEQTFNVGEMISSTMKRNEMTW